MRVSMWPGIALLVGGTVCAWLAWPASVQAQSSCSPSSPAPISGSTGAQGVLDPTNLDASLGLVWPAGAVSAFIDMDTGGIEFESASAVLSTASLPGISSTPAFPDGKLHFTSVHLPAGIALRFGNSSSGLRPGVLLLSCQDIILAGNSSLGWRFTTITGGPAGDTAPPGAFLGARVRSGVENPAGFGPRSGSVPAAGSLYPPIGGAGGNASGTLDGKPGGPAFVLAAAQRVTLNGIIAAYPPSADIGSATPPAQGGGGGSVRLAAVLVEGNGTIITSGGLDSDGVKRSPDGPIEIQAFLQDLFTGTASTTPIRSNPVVAPIPDNLPLIHIDSVSTLTESFFLETNTGSLTSPDITFLTPAASSQDVTVEVFTQGVPLTTSLTFRAVGTDGSVIPRATDPPITGSVGACDCLDGEGFASAILPLNPGVTYQIVVYPDTAFTLANLNTNPGPMRAKPVYAGLQIVPNEQKTEASSQKLEVRSQTKVAAKPVAEKPLGTRDLSPLEKWARAFGVDPEAHQKMAQLKTAP